MSAVLDLQSRTLLERVRSTATEAIAAAEWDAAAQVAAILRAARAEAHARVRAAARAKRERVAERCRKTLAEAETRERTSAFEIERALAARALAALPAALEARWSDAAARHEWCVAAASIAARRLVARDWVVTLAAGASDADRDAIRAQADGAGTGVRFDVDGPPASDGHSHPTAVTAAGTALRAGLRIVAGGVTVDATPGGLLADRATVESLVLAALVPRGAA